MPSQRYAYSPSTRSSSSIESTLTRHAVQVDYNKFATVAGLKTAASARELMRVTKNKLRDECVPPHTTRKLQMTVLTQSLFFPTGTALSPPVCRPATVPRLQRLQPRMVPARRELSPHQLRGRGPESRRRNRRRLMRLMTVRSSLLRRRRRPQRLLRMVLRTRQ
jgi:hypothetical protein